ncbi:hypothetical protein [Patiriisocius hiemis]|uniref:Lipoprotein n=1 Tax=Patiriisocius hiemis TaxID=3075604 RepID=A0ABU2YDX7_9FLAO|nr:hypothetical protein [Constantimarinum sp. W242]MDT0555253.1 hypothetical protein [Constantimarinum sp. W242]
MRLFLLGFILFFFLKCGSKTTNTSKDIINSADTEVTETNSNTNDVIISEETTLPPGAVIGNYINKETSFYAFVKKINKNKGITSIHFENNYTPPILIKETYGATIETLRFPEFESDLLLVTAKLKDPIFNKYFLYQFKNGKWVLVVNGFAIHEDNINEVSTPIEVDPNNPNNMLRFYSVFDLDKTSDKGYTWRLLQESVPIIK